MATIVVCMRCFDEYEDGFDVMVDHPTAGIVCHDCADALAPIGDRKVAGEQAGGGE